MLTDNDAANYLRQIKKLWSQSIEDDDAPLIFRPKQRPQNDRMNALDER
jgi:hypothetical protein